MYSFCFTDRTIRAINTADKHNTSSTIIPRRTYLFSSDHRSQAPSGLVSTRMGDRLGIPSVVGLFFFHKRVVAYTIMEFYQIGSYTNLYTKRNICDYLGLLSIF